MMLRRRRSAALAASAFIKARWMCKDALSRKGPMAAAEGLLGCAAELAGSADGRDQVLSLGLSAGAADIFAGRRPLDAAPSMTLNYARRRGEVEMRAPAESEAARSAARLVEAFANEAARPGYGAASARDFMLDCAALQAALWDAPEIPADDAVRAVMRLSAPLMRRQAKRRGRGFAAMRLFGAGGAQAR